MSGAVFLVPRLDRLIIRCGFGIPGGYEFHCTQVPSDAPIDFTKRLTGGEWTYKAVWFIWSTIQIPA